MAESMQRILFQRGLVGHYPDHQLKFLFVRSGCSRLEPQSNTFRVGGKRAPVVNAAGSVDTLLAVLVDTLAVQYMKSNPVPRMATLMPNDPLEHSLEPIYSV